MEVIKKAEQEFGTHKRAKFDPQIEREILAEAPANAAAGIQETRLVAADGNSEKDKDNTEEGAKLNTKVVREFTPERSGIRLERTRTKP